MNYFKTEIPAPAVKEFLKTLKAYDYEFCIVALKNNSTLVISNSQNLTDQLLLQKTDFSEITVPKVDIKRIQEEKQYKTTQGNHGLLID
ncbi:MAG: hypothetical protein WCH52_09385 [Bacteroidota bacterium]